MAITLDVHVVCPICHQHYEQKNSIKAPYVLPCGHVFCIGCLSQQPAPCPLCGVTCCSPRIFKPGGTSSSDEDISKQLSESISRVDEKTSLIRVRQLYETANGFLETQPRNRCKELEVNVKLLRALVLTKETLAAQSEKYERICSENVDLQSKLVQAGRSGAPCNISGHSEFNGLLNEMASFRAELNDVQDFIHGLQNDWFPASKLDPVSPMRSISSRSPTYAQGASLAREVDDDRFSLPPLSDIASQDDFVAPNSVPQTPVLHPVRLPEHVCPSIDFEEHRGRKGCNTSPHGVPPRPKNEVIDSQGVLSPLSCISSLRLYSIPSPPVAESEHPGGGLNVHPNKTGHFNPDDHTNMQNTGSDTDDDGDGAGTMSTSSISLLKTPEHLLGPNAAYLQMRLRDILRDSAESLVCGNIASNENQSSLAGDDILGIAASGLGLEIAGGAPRATTTPATLSTSCGPRQQGNLISSTDCTSLKLTSPTNLIVSGNRSTPSASSNLTLRSSRAPVGAPPGPSFMSKIPSFSLNKALDELAGSGSAGRIQGLKIDPNALAQRILHEIEGCIIEVAAQVFMQLLARARDGGFVNQGVDLLAMEDVGELIDLTDGLEEDESGTETTNAKDFEG